MTPKQAQQFNQMRATLKKIGREYLRPEQLRTLAGRKYGLTYEEALEAAYENIQCEAKDAIQGVRATPVGS